MSSPRLLLFWLLVLALPVQGFAATSKLLCDGARLAHKHAAGGIAAAAHVHSGAPGVGTEVHSHGHADPGVVSAANVDAPAHQCGLCAACCHAVAMAAEYRPVLAAPAAHAVTPDVVARIPVRGLMLPDKPPRS